MISKFDRMTSLRANVLAAGLATCTLAVGCRPSTPGEGEPQPGVSPQAPTSALPDAPVPPGAPADALDPQGGARSTPGEPAAEVALGEQSARATAVAELKPLPGDTAHGRVEFAETPNGLRVSAELEGLPQGTHGFHVHEAGDCSAPDGSSAGEHFGPAGDPHGAPTDPPPAHHAGDLGNVSADANGHAQASLSDNELTLQGEYGVVGRAIIVHANPDDLHSQPSGNSGDPIACGVIELDTSTDHGGTQPPA